MFDSSVYSHFIPEVLIAKHFSVGPTAHAYPAAVDILLPTYVIYCSTLIFFSYEAYCYTNYTYIPSRLCAHMIQHT